MSSRDEQQQSQQGTEEQEEVEVVAVAKEEETEQQQAISNIANVVPAASGSPIPTAKQAAEAEAKRDDKKKGGFFGW